METTDPVKTNPTIDLSLLILPITADAETGIDIRQDSSPHSIYYKIKDARNQARTIERQQSQGSTSLSAKEEWQRVITLGSEILSTQSKDLEVCAWLIEALLRHYGFAGLRDGFLLTHTLCLKYWDSLYPQDDDPYYKIAAFVGLNGEDSEGTLITPICSVPLTQSISIGPFCQWQYQQAIEISQMADADKKAKRIALGAVTFSDIDTAISETDSEFFRGIQADLLACLDIYDQLSDFFDKHCTANAPPSSRIRNALSQCLDTLKYLAGSALNPIDETPSVNLNEAGHSSPTVSNPTLNLDRDKAFEILQQIATYFRQTEPHSPVSYMIQKCVQWGKLSLPQLLLELVKDDNVRKQLCDLTGIVEVQQ